MDNMATMAVNKLLNSNQSYNKEFFVAANNEPSKDDDFNYILNKTLENEGGYTIDTGGATNYGITQNSFNSYLDKYKLPKKSVKDINFDDVNKFYYDEYYKTPKINLIQYPVIKGIIFDYAVNSGSIKAIKDLQDELGVESDGIIGQKTIKKLDTYVKQHGEDFLSHQILNRRASYYYKLADKNPDKYKKYLNGWINRISNLKNQYGLNTETANAQE